MDTTTLYFEGRGGDTLGQRGHTKDYRPHLNQMVVGIIMDGFAALACALLGSFLGLLEAIGFALDGEDLGVVDQAIDQGDDAGGVWKDLAPFGEGPVGGDERAVVLVPAADELGRRGPWIV